MNQKLENDTVVTATGARIERLSRADDFRRLAQFTVLAPVNSSGGSWCACTATERKTGPARTRLISCTSAPLNPEQASALAIALHMAIEWLAVPALGAGGTRERETTAYETAAQKALRQ